MVSYSHRLGRDPQPSAGSIDGQSAKTTSLVGLRGYDGGQQGKQVKGRTRHLLFDTERLTESDSVEAGCSVLVGRSVDTQSVVLVPAPSRRADPRTSRTASP